MRSDNMVTKIEIELDTEIADLIDKHVPFMGKNWPEVVENIVKSWLLDKYGIHTLREMLDLKPLIKE